MSLAEPSYSSAEVLTHERFGGKTPNGPPLHSGGGGGTFNGMEARVAVLENNVEYIKRDIGELKADMSGIRRDVESLKVGQGILTERVSHLPSKGFIVTATLSSLAVISALILFQDHIKAFLPH
jgi:hypothetical protein